VIVNVMLQLQIDTGQDSIRAAQWVAEDVRDWALRTLGVVKAQVMDVVEVTYDASL
jgi:type IV pilus biogenesis protein CpaD/CtpE